MFPIEWKDAALLNGGITARDSETPAGRRLIPLSDYYKAGLVRWRGIMGPEFCCYFFPNLKQPSTHMARVKKSWASTLKTAGTHLSQLDAGRNYNSYLRG